MDWRAELAAARAVPVDRRSLAQVVADVHPGATVAGVTELSGGLASLLDVVWLDRAPVERIVLRRLLPRFGGDPASLRREVAAHRAARAGGVPAPAVLWADDGGALGAPAMLVEFVEGRPIVAELDRTAAVTALVAGMDGVHAIRCREPAGLPVLADLAAHREQFGGPVTTSPVVDAAALLAAVDTLAGAFRAEQRLVHGDLHGGNVLWDGQQVTGVLDWPGAGWGVRLHDDAYAVMDTTLAHGPDAGERLRAEMRVRHGAAAVGDDEWALWFGLALERALPTPAEWEDAFASAGCAVTGDLLEERFVAAVAGFLEATR